MRPCTSCVYKPVCGSPRTEPCAGRQTKTEKEKAFNKMVWGLYDELLDNPKSVGFGFDYQYVANLITKHGYNRTREILFEKQFA